MGRPFKTGAPFYLHRSPAWKPKRAYRDLKNRIFYSHDAAALCAIPS